MTEIVEVRSLDATISMEIAGKYIVLDGKHYDLAYVMEKFVNKLEEKIENCKYSEEEIAEFNSLEEAHKAIKEDEDLQPCFFFPDGKIQVRAAVAFVTQITKVIKEDGKEIERKCLETLYPTKEIKKELEKYIEFRNWKLKAYRLKDNELSFENTLLSTLEKVFKKIDWENGDANVNRAIMESNVFTVDAIAKSQGILGITNLTLEILDILADKAEDKATQIKEALAYRRNIVDNY